MFYLDLIKSSNTLWGKALVARKFLDSNPVYLTCSLVLRWIISHLWISGSSPIKEECWTRWLISSFYSMILWIIYRKLKVFTTHSHWKPSSYIPTALSQMFSDLMKSRRHWTNFPRKNISKFSQIFLVSTKGLCLLQFYRSLWFNWKIHTLNYGNLNTHYKLQDSLQEDTTSYKRINLEISSPTTF